MKMPLGGIWRVLRRLRWCWYSSPKCFVKCRSEGKWRRVVKRDFSGQGRPAVTCDDMGVMPSPAYPLLQYSAN